MSSSRGPINVDTQVVAVREHVTAEMDDELVVLSLKSGEYFGMNEVASMLWRMIQTPRRVDSLRDEILQFYEGVTAEECTDEIIRLLHDMSEMELINVTRADATT